ncbi:hypothetical protein P691DRAFT_760784 [Macrolepiota fuliginosa MF-IS2]|uniref:Uncharacterized protein n=1 Tax=Macrolepiota fuliginosa MF-IS2 TaxID=1400762 RepID=A0A9P6C3N2_9AGAR|nr:hypothetical protein P691DRAFT_760784 [Macrolepiota fuliginosa MF-IS2]
MDLPSFILEPPTWWPTSNVMGTPYSLSKPKSYMVGNPMVPVSVKMSAYTKVRQCPGLKHVMPNISLNHHTNLHVLLPSGLMPLFEKAKNIIIKDSQFINNSTNISSHGQSGIDILLEESNHHAVHDSSTCDYAP